jgi:transcriptional regulator with XRE-family HTH domain
VTRHLGDVLRGYREAAGLSKNALARRAGIDVSLISRIEGHVHHTMTPDNLARISRVLRVRVEEVQAAVGVDGDGPPANEYPLEEWVARDPNLTDEGRAAVLAVYRALVGPPR